MCVCERACERSARFSLFAARAPLFLSSPLFCSATQRARCVLPHTDECCFLALVRVRWCRRRRRRSAVRQTCYPNLQNALDLLDGAPSSANAPTSSSSRRHHHEEGVRAQPSFYGHCSLRHVQGLLGHRRHHGRRTNFHKRRHTQTAGYLRSYLLCAAGCSARALTLARTATAATRGCAGRFFEGSTSATRAALQKGFGGGARLSSTGEVGARGLLEFAGRDTHTHTCTSSGILISTNGTIEVFLVETGS